MGSQACWSQNWKRKNDAAMVPDRGFVKQLKCLCPTYEVIWDWGYEKWEIWNVPNDRPAYHITTIQTKNRTYRELSTQVLIELQKCQYINTNMSTEEIINYLDEMDNQVRRRAMQDFRNKIQSIAADTFLHCAGVLQIQVPKKYRVERSLSHA